MKQFSFISILMAFVAMVVIAGCGGANAPGSRADTNPIVSIDWPTRSRGIDGPSSALSARIILHDTVGSQPDNTLFVVRSSNTAAHTETYTLPAKSKLGPYNLKIIFHSGADEQSQGIGIVDVDVRLKTQGLFNPNGSTMGHIEFEHMIEAVTVTANQTVGVGGIQQLTATARDEFFNPVVVSPGSFVWKLRSGQANMSISLDGIATGIAAGSAIVYATVDTVQSSDTAVSVLQSISSVVDVASNDLAYDSINGLIWSTVGNTGPYANSIVGINPSTGLVTRTIPIGAEPNKIAVTDNGEFAYVSIPADGTTKRVNLAAGTVSLTIPTGNVVSMTTVPGSPNTILVGDDPNAGVNVSAWDNAVRRANTGAGGNFIHMASPTIMYGNGGTSLFTCVLAPGVINWTAQNENLITRDFTINNGLLIDEAGHVVNPNTMTQVAQLPTNHFMSDGLGIASSASDNRAYIITWGSSPNKQILSYDLSNYSELPVRDAGVVPGGATDLIACGNHTIAFRNFSGPSANQVFIVRGLP